MAKKGTAKKTSKPAASRRTAPAGEGVSASGAKDKSIYYVVYVDTYVSDSEILARGLYVADKGIARLDASSPKYVRKFIGSVPDKIVHEIADQLKVSVMDEEGNYRNSGEILDELVSVI